MISTASTVLALSALLGAVAGASTCAADNCLRAVRASAFPTRMGTVDCSSYFLVTVTPATTVIISTSKSVTLTTTTTDVPAMARRGVGGGAARGVKVVEVRQVTVSASSIPAYASACSGASRYSSACSCVGVTHSTITAAAPRTTTTTTTTATSVIVSTSTLPAVAVPPSLNVLQYSDDNCQILLTPPTMIITSGQCVVLPEQISEKYVSGSFNPGTCATTAADCTVSFYFDSGCSDSAASNSADSTNCVDVSDFFSMKLNCPLC